MRRMFSKLQLIALIIKTMAENIVNALLGKDINVEGITCKGIANTGNVGITGDLAVSGSINGEENPSLKPIYCHPITLEGSSGDEMRLTMLIFNNSATPFTKASFIQWLDDLFTNVGATTRILISGGFINSSKICIGSYIGKISATNYYVIGIDAATGSSEYRGFTNEELNTWITALSDGVNKIN